MHILRKVVVSEVRGSAPDLSMRQLAILLTTQLDKEAQTVRGLAAHLKISKPAVTRNVDRLEEEGLAQREPDRRDKRSVLIGRTQAGTATLKRLRAALKTAVESDGHTPG